MRSLYFGGFALLASAIAPSQAYGQAWIGLMVGDMMAQQHQAMMEAQCMNGVPMKDVKVEDAQAPSIAMMQDYWRTVSASSTANVSTHFHPDTKRARWASGGVTKALAGLTAVSDPFPRASLVMDRAPVAFFRAGDGQTAAGQWIVRDAAGKRGGTYNAIFDRKAGVWKLQQLDLVDGKTYAPTLLQYCHKLDDVLPYRVSNSGWLKTFTEKRFAKGDAKAKAAEAEAAKAQAAADAAKPSAKSTKLAAAKLATEAAQKARESADERKAAALQAAEAEAKAKADAEARRLEIEAGKAALAAAG